jgi:hypothetical protein
MGASDGDAHAAGERPVPGLAILRTVVGFNLLGEASRDGLDPRG